MKREEKYPDTKWFHYYNANPKKRITGDCVYRALSLFFQISWEDAVYRRADAIVKTFKCGGSDSFDAMMKLFGYTKMKQPKHENGTKYTGKEFCEEIARKGTLYFCKIGTNHVVCIKDKKVWDIWDSTNGCIGNYWIRKEE